jgi:hypothetical protein
MYVLYFFFNFLDINIKKMNFTVIQHDKNKIPFNYSDLKKIELYLHFSYHRTLLINNVKFRCSFYQIWHLAHMVFPEITFIIKLKLDVPKKIIRFTRLHFSAYVVISKYCIHHFIFVSFVDAMNMLHCESKGFSLLINFTPVISLM